MFKFSIIDKDRIKDKLKALPSQLETVRLSIGNNIADSVAKDVRQRIPDRAGWLRTYKSAINFYYDGHEWAVAGEKEVDISEINAEVSLVNFTGGDDQSIVLSAYNPWPIDLVPATGRSYSGVIKIYSASQGEVSRRRGILISLLPKIHHELGEKGYSVDPYGIAILGGKKIADLKFLSQQLEYGLGPFPRVPHWSKAVSEISNKLVQYKEKIRDQFKDSLAGRLKLKALPTSSDLAKMLKSAKRIHI